MALDIVRPDGQKVETAITEVKVHNNEELDREKVLANQVFKNLMEEYAAARRYPKDVHPIVKPDEEAVLNVVDAKWRDYCRTRNANSTAKEPLDENLLRSQITQGLLQAEQMMRMKRALHELHDLEEFGFKLVGMVPQGALWMSVNCAIACAPKGPVHIWVRTVREDISLWCAGWSPVPTRDPIVEMMDYSVEGLHGLLMHLGVPRIVPLTEEQMALCRAGGRVSMTPMVVERTSGALVPIALCVSVAALILAALALVY